MIRAVCILDQGGVCVYSRIYDQSLADPQLMGSLISALSLFSRETMGDELRAIRSGGHLIIVSDTAPITTMVVADRAEDVTSELVDAITLRFLSRYAHIIKRGGELSALREFDAVLDELIPLGKTAGGLIEPRTPLDSLALIDLPADLRDLAVLLLRERELSATDAARSLSVSEVEALEMLHRLVSLGVAGLRMEDGRVVFFL